MLANREETPSQVAAGGREARDWDVFKQMLNSTRVLQSTETKPVHDLLSGYAAARRIDAQDHLTSTVAHHGSRFEKVRQELLDNLQQPDKDLHNAHFGELGMAHLSTLIGTLNEAVGGNPMLMKNFTRCGSSASDCAIRSNCSPTASAVCSVSEFIR